MALGDVHQLITPYSVLLGTLIMGELGFGFGAERRGCVMR